MNNLDGNTDPSFRVRATPHRLSFLNESQRNCRQSQKSMRIQTSKTIAPCLQRVAVGLANDQIFQPPKNVVQSSKKKWKTSKKLALDFPCSSRRSRSAQKPINKIQCGWGKKITQLISYPTRWVMWFLVMF